MGIRHTQPTDEDGEYYFDERAAQAACDFFETYLILFEGEWCGQPFRLMGWQKLIIRNIFGWKRTSDGTRRYRTCYVWIPRKNTKSTLAAGVSLLLLMGDAEPGGQVYYIARTESQAKIAFNFAAQFVANSPPLSREITPFKVSLWVDRLGAVARYLTGKPAGKHGLNASGLIGDEIHEWADDDLFTYVHQSEGTRRQPMDFLISTAGLRDGVGWDHWKFCEAALNGEVDAPDTFVFIAAADPEKDASDPQYWASDEAIREANPSLGETVKLEFLRAEIEKAKSNPRRINDVKRYYLNLWTSQAMVWLNMAAWDKCGFPKEPQPELDRMALPHIYRGANLRWMDIPERFVGQRCFGALDLSSTSDLTAFVLLFSPTDDSEVWTILPRFYLPEDGIEEKGKKDAFDYVAANEVGALCLTPGDVVDYDFVRTDILDHRDRFAIEALAIDKWNATQIATQLSEDGLNVEYFRQGYQSLSGPSKYLERLVLQRHIDHGGHPVLRWNARNAAVTRDPMDNIKPVKDKSTGRIDGILAAIMAVGISDEFIPKFGLGPEDFRL